VISRARASARAEIENAQRELDAERAEREEVAAHENFSAVEAAMGEPDFGSPERPDFDSIATAATRN